jgi:hypothetical protein
MLFRTSASIGPGSIGILALCASLVAQPHPRSSPGDHPRLLFRSSDVPTIRARAAAPALAAVNTRLRTAADAFLTAPPIVPSITKRGEPDPPGESKGIASARRLQVRVLTLAMAFTLTGERRYRDKAVALLDDAIQSWRIWVDTAHTPPYDLMTAENAMTLGLAYDWLHADLTPEERQRLRDGAERRVLRPYLEAATGAPRPHWLEARNNWNTVCNGGAAVLALALEGESDLAERVLSLAVPAMQHYWNHLKDDGGWDEGTGYWTYGHRYGLIAAEALRRVGRPGGAEIFARPGVRRTGYFPIVFNPGRTISASFGDVVHRASDPIFYLLAREYQNADFVWFQDRHDTHQDPGAGWPQDPLTLLWRPFDEPWLPDAKGASFTPSIDPVYAFPRIGWAMMASRQPDPPFFLAFKSGSLAANHTHLDLNHVTIGVGETLIARELGSRPYPADYFGPNRFNYYEITTKGHNTVLVGGRGQVPKKAGRLIGPTTGPDHAALVGIADDAYEVDTPRARRHAVFVDRRYWVLLDEIATSAPQPIELRFHTEGDVQLREAGRWTFMEGDARLDIVSATKGMHGTIEQLDGWIRPLRALSLKKPAASAHAVVTVLMPRAAADDQVEMVEQDDAITLTVDGDRILFTRAPDGWRLVDVRLRRAPV